MPPLKDVTTMVTAARSRKIRFNFIIQNFSQLNDVYGKENAETIKGNCGNIIYLISSELVALKEISEMCGEVKSKKDDKTASTPLVTVSDLQRLPKWTMILLRTRCMPFKTKMTPNFQMVKDNSWGKNYPKAEYPQREKQPVQVFDLKGFVSEKRDKKISEMLGGDFTKNSSIPGMPPMFPGMNSTPSIPPFPGMSPKGGAFDPDELIKKIDAKIAELEEQERLEKEQNAKEQKKEEVVESENKEKFNLDDITDDQFFDDFFNDD